MSQTKQVQIPAEVTISGQLAVELGQYIQSNPCPGCAVAVALKLCGGLEMALQAAAGNGVSKQPNGADVLARANALLQQESSE